MDIMTSGPAVALFSVAIVGICYLLWRRFQARKDADGNANPQKVIVSALVALKQIVIDTARVWLQGERPEEPEKVSEDWPAYQGATTRDAFIGAIRVIQRTVPLKLAAELRLAEIDDDELEQLQEERRQQKHAALPGLDEDNIALKAEVLHHAQRMDQVAARNQGVLTAPQQPSNALVSGQLSAVAEGLAKNAEELEEQRELWEEKARTQSRLAYGILAAEGTMLAVGNLAGAAHALSPLEQAGAVFGGLAGACWLTHFAAHGPVALLEWGRSDSPGASVPAGAGTTGPGSYLPVVSPANPGATHKRVSAELVKAGVCTGIFVLSAPALAVVRDQVFGGQVDGINVPMLVAQTLMSMGASLYSANASRRAELLRRQMAVREAAVETARQQAIYAEAAAKGVYAAEQAQHEAVQRAKAEAEAQLGRLHGSFAAWRADCRQRHEERRMLRRDLDIDNYKDQTDIIGCRKQREEAAIEELVGYLLPTLEALADELDRLKEAELEEAERQRAQASAASASAAPAGSAGATGSSAAVPPSSPAAFNPFSTSKGAAANGATANKASTNGATLNGAAPSGRSAQGSNQGGGK